MTYPQEQWGAPGPAPQQQWQQPPPAKGGKGLIIGLVVILLLVVVGVGGYFAFTKLVSDDDDSSGDDKSSSKEKLISPEGQPFSFALPAGMKQVSADEGTNAPAVRLEPTKPQGDNPDVAVELGTFDSLAGQSADDLFEEVESDPSVEPKRIKVDGLEAVDYTANLPSRERSGREEEAPKSSQQPKPSESPKSSPKASPQPSDDEEEEPGKTPGPDGDDAVLLRVILVPIPSGEVIAINCSYDSANADAIRSACDDVVKSLKVTKTQGEPDPSSTAEPKESTDPDGEPKASDRAESSRGTPSPR